MAGQSPRLSAKRNVRRRGADRPSVGHHAVTLDFFDPVALRRVISGTDVHHTLLPGGKPTFEHHLLHFGEATVATGRYGAAVLAEGAWPSGTVSIGFAADATAPITVNGYVGRPRSVQFYAEGASIDYRAAPNTTWMAYTIRRERLQHAMELRAGRPLPLLDRGVCSFDPDPTAAAKLAAWLQRASAEPTNGLAGGGREAWARRREEELQRILVDIFLGAPEAAPAGTHSTRRKRVAACAEDFLQANLGGRFDLAALARAVGSSERMVQHHFQQIYGTSPGRWFRARKLEVARAELHRSTPKRTRVTDVALRAGFRHLGRFSTQYRKLFGETPRQTLQR